jgi:hypothetical protein
MKYRELFLERVTKSVAEIVVEVPDDAPADLQFEINADVAEFCDDSGETEDYFWEIDLVEELEGEHLEDYYDRTEMEPGEDLKPDFRVVKSADGKWILEKAGE